MSDDYQRRYLEHRERKTAMIERKLTSRTDGIYPGRRSVRVFTSASIPRRVLRFTFEAVLQAPQSCNRQAITLRVVPGPDVGEYLAGGEGWAYNAPTVVLLFADLLAYKSPNEIDYMPWLDAGVVLATLANAAANLGLASCIINPHVRRQNRATFNERFNPKGRLFCGAVALGYAGIIPAAPEKKPMEELVE